MWYGCDTVDQSYHNAKGAADLKGSSFGLLQGPRSCWSTGAPHLRCTGGSDSPANTSLQSWGGAYPPAYKPDVMHCRQGVLCYQRYTAEELQDNGGRRGKGTQGEGGGILGGRIWEMQEGHGQREVWLIRPVPADMPVDNVFGLTRQLCKQYSHCQDDACVNQMQSHHTCSVLESKTHTAADVAQI